nr:leucyl/phenylalanyl-tRNA--protein transferase [Brevundimonas naejangsanensis]
MLACYARGVFPMAEARDDPRVFLVEPDQRGVLPLDRFHIPSRLRRTVRGEPFEVRVNTAFAAVLDACAAPGPGREDTWINAPIRRLYIELHQRGFAHSVECWRDEALVGGLYGVTLGGAFFGESMFSRARDASKVALVHLVARLKRGGWRLLDAQFLTEHLAQFGALETPQAAYLRMLPWALQATPDVVAFNGPMTGEEAVAYALQPTTQAS